MKNRKLLIFVPVLWAALTLALWFGPRTDISDSERRPLASFPDISVKSILSGKFMEDFEDFTLDQFPARDTFRTLKSLFHYYILGQSDNNGIYLQDGYAAKLETTLNTASISHAVNRFTHLYETCLSDSRVFMAIVPDKGYYLAESSGHPALDYDKLFASFREKLPFAAQIDLTDTLSISDYYRTDTHWKQENLISVASKLAEHLGIPAPKAEDYTPVTLDRPFYGVYYGQAALPMQPDQITYLRSDILENCTVYDHETGKTTSVYDLSKETSKDLYDIFLSGAKPLLTIENPAVTEEKELIVFRDSFGSSLIPLLTSGYSTVTVVDIRYIGIDYLSSFMDFRGQDVLLLYSTLILNSSDTLK